MIINGLINKINKGEAEQLINAKIAELTGEVEKTFSSVDMKYD